MPSDFDQTRRKLDEAASKIEQEIRSVIQHLNDHVVPKVRSLGSHFWHNVIVQMLDHTPDLLLNLRCCFIQLASCLIEIRRHGSPRFLDYERRVRSEERRVGKVCRTG